jgi:hypothetical protein
VAYTSPKGLKVKSAPARVTISGHSLSKGAVSLLPLPGFAAAFLRSLDSGNTRDDLGNLGRSGSRICSSASPSAASFAKATVECHGQFAFS